MDRHADYRWVLGLSFDQCEAFNLVFHSAIDARFAHLRCDSDEAAAAALLTPKPGLKKARTEESRSWASGAGRGVLGCVHCSGGGDEQGDIGRVVSFGLVGCGGDEELGHEGDGCCDG